MKGQEGWEGSARSRLFASDINCLTFSKSCFSLWLEAWFVGDPPAAEGVAFIPCAARNFSISIFFSAAS